MKYLLCTTAFILLASPAFSLGDSAQANNGGAAVIGNGNKVNTGPVNSGPNAGGSLKNTNNNVNVSNSDSYSKSSSTSFSDSSAYQTQGQYQSADSQVKNSGNSDVSVSQTHNYKRNPVSTAWAAPLVAADDTCMGSTSAGGQGVGFGLSLGSTWTDSDCVRRKDARELHNMGHPAAAIALLCQSDQVRKAMADAGTPCVGSTAEAESRQVYRTSARAESQYPGQTRDNGRPW